MNRLVALAFAIAFLPLAAFAQKETVEVDGKDTLSGLWKISFPAGASGILTYFAVEAAKLLGRK